MSITSNLKELYRSRPIKSGIDSVAYVLKWEIPLSAFEIGVDGWTSTDAGSLPAFGDSLTTCRVIASWTGYNEPRIADLAFDPRYRAGFGLMAATFVGSRLWVD